MKYEINKKEIEIPDEEIEKLMDTLDLTEEEAIDTWLCDNDYEDNEEEQELTKKAKANRITATIHKAKDDEKEKKPRAKVKKEYPDKELIIKVLNDAVAALGVTNLQITNKAKNIEFGYNGETYKIDLVQRRKPKEDK